MTKEQLLTIQQTGQIDPMVNQPLAVGIEALIATIEDNDELRKALIEYVGRKRSQYLLSPER